MPSSVKTSPSPEMIEMLLAERFQLQVHAETKSGDGWASVVTAKGPRFTVTKDREAFSVIASGRTDNPERPSFIRSKNASMAQFARHIAEFLHTPVLDKTALPGYFDFEFEYADKNAPDAGPSLVAVIQDQLGLKVVPANVSIRHLIIDRAEKPSEN